MFDALSQMIFTKRNFNINYSKKVYSGLRNTRTRRTPRPARSCHSIAKSHRLLADILLSYCFFLNKTNSSLAVTSVLYFYNHKYSAFFSPIFTNTTDKEEGTFDNRMRLYLTI